MPRPRSVDADDANTGLVPSGKANPSTDSTIEIIRQVREYGLGMVLASQAPKGIHHQALGNTVEDEVVERARRA